MKTYNLDEVVIKAHSPEHADLIYDRLIEMGAKYGYNNKYSLGSSLYNNKYIYIGISHFGLGGWIILPPGKHLVTLDDLYNGTVLSLKPEKPKKLNKRQVGILKDMERDFRLEPLVERSTTRGLCYYVSSHNDYILDDKAVLFPEFKKDTYGFDGERQVDSWKGKATRYLRADWCLDKLKELGEKPHPKELKRIDHSLLIGTDIICKFWNDDSDEYIYSKYYPNKYEQIPYPFSACTGMYKNMSLIMNHWYIYLSGKRPIPEGYKFEVMYRNNSIYSRDDVFAWRVTGIKEGWKV